MNSLVKIHDFLSSYFAGRLGTVLFGLFLFAFFAFNNKNF
jgi:hypothetical protein